MAADEHKPRSPGSRRKTKVPGAKKIRRKELPTFVRQLAAMLSSGMPVVQTLTALEEQVENPNFKVVVSGAREQIEGGASFSEAFAGYPDVFDELFISMLRAGESGGVLAETTGRIAGYLEAQEKLRRKVVSAMSYPVIVLSIVLLITTAIIMFLVPRFAGIYADFDADLPIATRILVVVSDTVRNYSLHVLGVAVTVGIAVGRLKRTERGAYIFDNLMLNLPIVGELVRKVALARFAGTFAQMIRSGVPILPALDIVANATGNRVLGSSVRNGREVVERGEPLSSALDGDANFPRMLVHMLAAGEKTGRMEDMLQKVAEFYDDEVDAMLAGLTSMLEPLLIVVLGVVVGGIMLALFMPIFKMHEMVAM